MAAGHPQALPGAEGIHVVRDTHVAALQRYWVCPRCTLHNSLATFECGACAYRRPRPPRQAAHSSGGGRQRTDLAALAVRAAVAGMAGLALGRASSHQRGMQRLAITALAVAAVPLANALLGRMLGGGRRQQQPAGGGRRHARTPAEREARRLRLWDAVQHAAEAAAAVGMVPPEEQELLTRVMQPSGSRIERVRTITGVLERLREMEARPEPHSRTLGLISALVVHELNMLVDAMDYEELYAAFGGPHPHKGLSAERIAALPAVKLSEAGLAALHSHTCAVCLEAFQAGEVARPLPGCGHTFHAACVDAWLESKPLCPVCRANVAPPEGEVTAAAGAAGAEEAAAGAAGEVAAAGAAGEEAAAGAAGAAAAGAADGPDAGSVEAAEATTAAAAAAAAAGSASADAASSSAAAQQGARPA